MAGRNEFRALPPTLESFGVAIDFLSRHAPFSTVEVGVFTRAVRRQILRGEHVIAWDGETITGYAGWLPTTTASAQRWLAHGGELAAADVGGDADAVALTTVAVDDPKVVLGLIRASRDLNPGLRVFFKRSYADAGRPSRKSAVLNRSGAGAGATPVATPPAQRRPPIADDPCGTLFALAETAPGTTRRVPVGEGSVLVVQSPEIAARVLVGNGANYIKNFSSFTPLFGASRLTLDGDEWRRSQRLTQPFIAPHDVPRAEAILVDRYSELADRLASDAGAGSAIDGLVDRAAIDALAALAFSTDGAALGEGFAADLRTVIRFCTSRAFDLPGVPPAPLDAGGAERAAGRIRAAVQGLVLRRRASAAKPQDALTALIEAADRFAATPDADPLDLAGEIVTLIVAGSDTTSAALGWALSILAEHEAFQEQLRSEVAAATDGRRPGLDDVDKAPSLRPFIEETLRMFPPVPILSRFAVAADVLDGHEVTPDDRVLVSVIGLHQNPSAWDAPREFRLDRHEGDERSRSDRRSVFLPFSAGQRICGGARFAQMEMALALMLVLQRARLDLPAPLPLAFEWGASMRRRGGQVIRATPL